MTVIDEQHKFIVRHWHTNAEQPLPPAEPYLYERTEPARVVDPDTNEKLTTHFYDPLTPISPPADPPAYGGALTEVRERIVRFRHTAPAPAAPALGLTLKAALTQLIDAVSGLYVTLYRFDPGEPAAGGEDIAFGDAEIFTFGDDEVFAFGAA